MTTSKTSTQLSFASLSSAPEDIRASLFPEPDSEEARKTTVTSGLRCSELYKSAGRLGCLQRMLLVTSQWVSTKCFLTWKEKTTPANRLLFQLVPKMPATDETESGLWVGTPKATQSIRSEKFRKGRTPTPEELVMWATPRASTAMSAENIQNRVNDRFPNLESQVAQRLWPTPDTQNHRDGSKLRKDNNLDQGGTHGVSLHHAVYHENVGSLNPTWVEWLMGYPPGWTDCEDLETPLSHKSPTKS